MEGGDSVLGIHPVALHSNCCGPCVLTGKMTLLYILATNNLPLRACSEHIFTASALKLLPLTSCIECQQQIRRLQHCIRYNVGSMLAAWHAALLWPVAQKCYGSTSPAGSPTIPQPGTMVFKLPTISGWSGGCAIVVIWACMQPS
jgi:hypothetical protein